MIRLRRMPSSRVANTGRCRTLRVASEANGGSPELDPAHPWFVGFRANASLSSLVNVLFFPLAFLGEIPGHPTIIQVDEVIIGKIPIFRWQIRKDGSADYQTRREFHELKHKR
jgi:hypothetical protein